MIRLVSSRFDLFRFVWSRLVSFLFLGIPRDWDSLFANSGDEDGLDRDEDGDGDWDEDWGERTWLDSGRKIPGEARGLISRFYFLLVSVAF